MPNDRTGRPGDIPTGALTALTWGHDSRGCQDDRVPDTRALLFDVFGTLVDWRGSLLDESADLGARSGVLTNWAAVVDDWRRAYQPALDRVRAGSGWRDLDALQHETLTEVLRRHGVALPGKSVV